MEEKWLPAEHTLTFRVEVNPDEAVVRAKGKSCEVQRVDLTYGRVADEVNEWEEPVVEMWTRGGHLYRDEIDEIPQWLADIEARAQIAVGVA